MTRDIGRYLPSKFRGDNLGAFAILASFLVLALTSLPRLSQTTDEPLHYRYGRKILQSDAGRFDDSKMPVSALNAFPAWLGERLPEGRISRGLRYWQVARLPTLAAAVGLGLVVLAWSRKLFGRSAGLLSLALFVFDPNILAHSRLVTTDLYLAASAALSLFLFWRFARRRTLGRAVAAALALGLAQITKYTAVALFPLFGLLILVYDLPRLSKALRRRSWQIAAGYLVWSSFLVALFFATAIAIINFAFVRERTFRPLQDYVFQSQFFRGLQSRAAGAAWLRVPVPYPYLQGLDAVLYRERSNVGYGQIYLLGELRRGEGFPAYFLVAYALKTPLASQAVFLLAIAGLIRGRSWRGFVRQEQFLVVPLIAFGVYFSFFFRAQIGIRFVLMMFPLMHILAGRLVQGMGQGSKAKRFALVAGMASVVVSTLSYFPDFLAYFNEIVWDRRLAYRYLADSNLDWGQSDIFLEEYVADHPETMVEPLEISVGEIIVRVNSLVGITEDPDRYATLREECTPVATIGHAYLLFLVPCGEEGETEPKDGPTAAPHGVRKVPRAGSSSREAEFEGPIRLPPRRTHRTPVGEASGHQPGSPG